MKLLDEYKFLRQTSLVPSDQLEQIHRQAQQEEMPLSAILIRQGLLDEEDYLDRLARELGTAWRELPEQVDPNLLGLIPTEFGLEHQVLPIARENGFLEVIAEDPSDLQLGEDLRMLTGIEVKLLAGRREPLLRAVQKFYGDSIENMIARFSEGDLSAGQDDRLDISNLRAIAGEPTVVNLLNLVMFQAVEEEASDIHIEPFEEKLLVKYRIDGVLQERTPPPKHLQQAIISRVKIMANMDIAERYLPQDGHIRLHINSKEIDLRVSTVPTVFGESVVMRILNKSSILLGVHELGFQRDTEKKFAQLLKNIHGIILVTGPTGSGKTTTLYSALHHIFTPEKKFITIEDPVEYQLHGINQIQVNVRRGLTFAKGLRHIVRQDPDIIMVGEIRDLETAEISIRSALTGHLVYSTLHTNNAPGAVARLLDMGIDPFLISSSLIGVLAQRLLRRICKVCREPYKPDSELLLAAKIPLENNGEFYHGVGCARCNNTGYRGRIGIFELLVFSDELRALILERPSTAQIEQLSKIRPMNQDGWMKALAGMTTVEEVLRVTQEETT